MEKYNNLSDLKEENFHFFKIQKSEFSQTLYQEWGTKSFY